MRKHILPFVIFIACGLQAIAQNYHVNEDFNAATLPTGWSNNAVSGTQVWSFGIDGANLHNGNQNLDGTNMAYFDDDSYGSSSVNNTVELLTPTFDNSTSTQTYLEFDYNFRQLNTINDSFYVEVYDGSNWNRVLSLGSDDCGNYMHSQCNIIPHALIDISAYNNANCQVRFVYSDDNDWGYYVALDNVEIYSLFPIDLQVADLVRPSDGCGFAGTDSIEVEIQNTGSNPASNFSVSYVVDGGTVVTENVSATVPASGSINYVFNTTANLSTVKTYQIVAYTQIATDGDFSNDTLTTTVEHETSYSLTYTEDFESSDGGWTVTGSNASWEWGTPNNAIISTAGSGNKAWVTDLNGDYNNLENSYLTSPCFDFGATIGDPILGLLLNYDTENRFDVLWVEYSLNNGATWTKLPAGGPNPLNWYSNTTTQVWEGRSQSWLSVENVLVGLGGEPQVKLRFALQSDGSSTLEGVGVDLVTIREPQPIDLAVNEMVYPSTGSAPLCGYGTNENIILEIENKGANPVDSFEVAYRIDNGGIRRDTVTTTILPNTLINYSHAIKANLSGIRTYNLTVWVRSLDGNDGFTPNDTLFNQLVSNSSNVAAGTLPYSEDFESFTQGSINGQNGWTANPISATTFSFGWRAHSGQPASGTGSGPSGDHTTGNGIYAHLESSGTGQNAVMESPCLDLSQNTGARMSFWYHRHGSTMQPTYVDVYDGKNWVNVDVITAQPQTNASDDWTYHEVNINAYAGRRIKIRFRGSSTQCCSGDQAIDDIRIIEPIPVDANLLGPIAPVYGCDVNDQSYITVEVKNDGSLDIQPNSMYMYYKVDTFPTVKDTFDVQLASENTTTFTFSQPADLSIQGMQYNIKTWVEIAGDRNVLNDTVFQYRVKNNTQSPFYFEDFETARDASCSDFMGQVLPNGWFTDYTAYAWQLQSSLCGQYDRVTPTGATGPSGDHTTGRGYFLYTDPTPSPYDTTRAGGSVAYLNSPCIDLTNHTNVAVGFWYHRYGNQMGSMDLEVYDNATGTWNSVWNITGQTHLSATDDWTYANVDISAYAGDFSQIRFVGSKSTNFSTRGNMAIDDIALYEIKGADVAVTEISAPNGDGCNLTNAANVTVRVDNIGSAAVPADSLVLSYTNNGGQLTEDTISQSIPSGSFIIHTFSNTVDLSGTGDQEIIVRAHLTDDTATYNNYLIKTVTNQSVGLPYYFQDFEDFGMGAGFASNDLRGWSRNPNNANQHSWRVWQGQAPLVAGDGMRGIPPNGPSGDHTFASDLGNGNGLYMILKSDFTFDGNRPDANLTTPTCDSIDFTQSQNNRILLSFWYHMFGDFTGDLFVDVYNGQQWVNGVSVIRGAQQQSPQEPWREKQITLDQFANVSNGLIRFRADYIGPIGGGDIGIDDIMLLDRMQTDLAVKQLKRPNSGCEMNNQERVRVFVQNTGTTDIFNVEMAYQVTFTPYPYQGVPSTTFPIERTSTIAQIVPYATYTFEFNDRLDMTQPGIYSIKVWSEIQGDQFAKNDTLVTEVVNNSRPFPSCEDFSGLLYGDNGNKYLGEQPGAGYGIMPNFWRAQKDAQEMYLWKASMQLPGGVGGPTRGHTSGENDLFMLVEGGMPGMSSYIESPCYDLTQTRAANLEFWYQAPSDRHFVLIEGDGGGGYAIIDTLWGKPVPGWTKVTYVLADYIGSYTTFKLTSRQHGDYVAIDDFCVVPPPPQQVRAERIVSPPDGRCYYDTLEPLTIRVQNVGIDDIDSLTFVVAIDTQAVAFPRGSSYFQDTFKVYTTNPALQPAMKMNITMPDSINLSHRVQYYFDVRVILPGDLDTTDQHIDWHQVLHPIPVEIPYVVDFDTPFEPGAAMDINPVGDVEGVITNGTRPVDQGQTGPAVDHTFQTAQGKYFAMPRDAGQQPALGDYVTLTSQCMNLSEAQAPELEFWYHMYGRHMGQLFVSVNDDYGWDDVDSIKGVQQGRQPAPWEIRQVDLTQYAGDYVKFRFTGIRGDGFASIIGLDDIFLFDLPSLDATPAGLARPTDFIYSCYTDTQSVYATIRNNGALDIDFTQDSAWLEVLIWKDGQPWDTLSQWVTQNWFVNKQNQTVGALPRDSSCNIKMDSTFDMSELDASFDFLIRIKLNGDVITINDTTMETVVHRREAGQIATVDPDETVCYNEPLLMEVENFFGKIRWQERMHDKDGNVNSSWTNGFSFPNNDSIYAALLDTTSDIRVQVCGQEVTNPVKIEVIRPFSGTAINSADCGLDKAHEVKVQLPYYGIGAVNNIDEVYIYEKRGDARVNYLAKGAPYDSTDGNQYFRYYYPKDTVSKRIREEAVLEIDTIIKYGDTVRFDTTYKLRHPLDLFVATTNDIEHRTNITCWSDGGFNQIDATEKLERTKLTATVNMPLNKYFIDTSYKEVCIDSVLVLNAGGAIGRTFDYDWTFILPDGSQTKDSSQQIIVSGDDLENGSIYKVVLTVQSDSGCDNTMYLPPEPGFPNGKDTLTIKAVDACAVSIDEEYLNEAFNIYPNPTSDDVFIELNVQADVVGTVKLIGIDGKLIEQHTNVNLSRQTTKFNLGNRSKGVYFIKIETDQGVITKKIVKS